MNRRHFFAANLTTAAAISFPNATKAVQESPKNRIPTAAEIRKKHKDLWLLVDLINAYRRSIRLPAVQLSAKLTVVAALHAKDLLAHEPHKHNRSLHSWSKNDQWTGGDYNATDKLTWPLMWDKPKELTDYTGYGFEICAADVRDPKHAVEVWQKSKSHNDVMVNRGPWANPRWKWQGLGAVFYKGYACAWFGNVTDDAPAEGN